MPDIGSMFPLHSTATLHVYTTAVSSDGGWVD